MSVSGISGSGDASILNTTIPSESPEAVDPEDIERILQFMKEYKDDERLQSSDEKLKADLQPKGFTTYSSLPSYILQRVRDKQWEEADKDVPSSEDVSKCLNPIDKKFVDYVEFCQIHSSYPESIKKLFKPHELAAKLMSESDAHGRVSVQAIQDVYSLKVDLLRFRMGLESFSVMKPEYLTFEELQCYLSTLGEKYNLFTEAGSLANSVAEIFAEIMFFKALGSNRSFVKITDLLVCGAVADFFESVNSEDDFNYFSIAAVKKIYSRFKNAEPIEGDYLTREHIYRLYDSIVPVFWDRYFELYQSEGKIYFIDFYKLSYMLDNLLDENVIRIFFRALDRDEDGIFSIEDYKPFHSQLMPAYFTKYGNSFDLDFVYSSLFDLALARDKITLKNVIDIQRFNDFFGMACDIEDFARQEGVGSPEDEEIDAEVEE